METIGTGERTWSKFWGVNNTLCEDTDDEVED